MTDRPEDVIRRYIRTQSMFVVGQHGSQRAALKAVDVLLSERDRNAPKVAAYDAARATVKIEGNTRAYYVLRAENAEADRDRYREALEAVKTEAAQFANHNAYAGIVRMCDEALAAAGSEPAECPACEDGYICRHGEGCLLGEVIATGSEPGPEGGVDA